VVGAGAVRASPEEEKTGTTPRCRGEEGGHCCYGTQIDAVEEKGARRGDLLRLRPLTGKTLLELAAQDLAFFFHQGKLQDRQEDRNRA
jgi:hypothetical protein